MMTWKPDIFSFADYRAFLRAYYDAAKENLPAFSYRSFAQSAKLSSQSFLRDVIRGEKNIGESGARFSKAMSLTKEESAFFELLIAFDQESLRAEKNKLFSRIASTKRFRNARRIDEGMYQYLSHWYYPAVREMLSRDDFQDDPHWISAQLEPKVGVREVKKALKVLLELGFVVKEGDTLVSANPTITTGHEASSLGVVNFHHEMLRLAAESIDRFPSKDRDLGAMTITIKKEDLPKLKAQIHAFREQILNYADEEEGGEIVVQFNTQLFPLNKVDS